MRSSCSRTYARTSNQNNRVFHLSRRSAHNVYNTSIYEYSYGAGLGIARRAAKEVHRSREIRRITLCTCRARARQPSNYARTQTAFYAIPLCCSRGWETMRAGFFTAAARNWCLLSLFDARLTAAAANGRSKGAKSARRAAISAEGGFVNWLCSRFNESISVCVVIKRRFVNLASSSVWAV